jgi:hypothetical protein
MAQPILSSSTVHSGYTSARTVSALTQYHHMSNITTRLHTKDCPLAQDNQIWLQGKQIFMQTCLTDNQILHIIVDI